MQTWEYKLFEPPKPPLFGLFDRRTLETEMNQLGAEGWELVAIVAQSESGTALHLLFKRPI